MLRPAANPKHGCIANRLRRSAALLATALGLLAVPATALANPLLSGYGGPGQGEQAILGGGLVNGPAGGSGGGGGSTAISTAPSEVTGATTTGGHATPTRRGRARSRSRRERHPTGSSTSDTSANGSAAGGSASRLPARAADSSSSQLLGLSGEDIVYAVLALVLLIATAVAVRRLTAPPSHRESAKGKERISRVVK